MASGDIRTFRVALARGGAVSGAGPVLALAAVLVVVYALVAHDRDLVQYGVIGLVASGLLTLFSGRSAAGMRYTVGELAIDDADVRFKGERLLRRKDITSGLIVRDWTGNARVRLTRRPRVLGSIELRVRDEENGRELLRVLGLDVTQRAEVFRVASQVTANPVSHVAFLGAAIALGAAVAAIASALHAPVPAFRFLLPMIVLGMIGALMAPGAKVTVGADGVLIASLGRRRFVSYADVAYADTYEDIVITKRWRGVELKLRSGESVRIACSQSRSLVGTERAEIIVTRIREAMASVSRGDPAYEAALLGRNARGVDDWIRALRGIGAGVVDHRTAPVPPDRLWQLLEDVTAPAVARAGAAVALGPTLDDEGRARLRVAAEASASPRLRVALAAATEDDDAALADALAGVDEEGASASAGGEKRAACP